MTRIPGNTKLLFTPIKTSGRTRYVSGGYDPKSNRLWIIVGPTKQDRVVIHPRLTQAAKLRKALT
jgi:hypothetical protein